MKKLLLLLFLLPLFYSCGSDDSSESTENITAYEKMHVVFTDKPSEETISKLMNPILTNYSLPIDEEHEEKFASALVSMKQQSAVGVTEMEILKYMYQHPDASSSLPEAIGKAATILEMRK
ncbi:hypothetical protein [uncultured Mucilaginibacter sp.]|uniref:hypothetical protein n=1 Tax=uncultured Mucilaginibacter sp. TaxID=797541 RepID=UPI0026053A90|nr:hypothetical protein [uncultured Mucilaginibacter sp.]